MTHQNKIKLARRMLTHEELLNRVPIFKSKAWLKRSSEIFLRTKKTSK